MQNSPELVLISYSSFKSNPPKDFMFNFKGDNDSTVNVKFPDRTQVTIISDKDEFSNVAKTTAVKTLTDLESFRKQIFDRPLFLLVICGKHVPRGQR